MKRAILIVIDSMGIGAMPDHADYGDIAQCNTLRNVCEFCGGLNVPNLQKMGLFNITSPRPLGEGARGWGQPTAAPLAQYGTMSEKSQGKDTTTGHWEIAGAVPDKPFATFPNGFAQELIEKFIAETNCGGILANRPASGTAIIEELNDEHHRTKFPIVYTSADSVFQIAVDTDLIPLTTLYDWCETARRLLDEGNYNVSRVIARPYKVIDGKPTRISKDRRDYSMKPPHTLLNEIEDRGKSVYGIGKIEDIFSGSGVTRAVHIGSNREGLDLTLDAVKDAPDALIFTNLVDTDMLYGHRNDATGYGRAIEEIDAYLDKITANMTDDDLLIITADHGCDPTVPGTDHTREYVPLLVYHKGIEAKDLGLLEGFDNVAKIIQKWVF
jgi:phosphopentomutase